MPLRSVRPEHLDRLYGDLLATGGVKKAGLAPKTVYDVHVVIRSAFTQAERQHLVAVNPALGAQPPTIPATPAQRSGVLDRRPTRRVPGRHPASAAAPWRCTSQRSPACVAANSPGSAGATGTSPRIGSPSPEAARSSPAAPSKSRSRPARAGAASTSTPTPNECSERGGRRQQRDGHPVGTNDPIFTNQAGQPVHPESIYQLFHRQVRRLDMPRICFHGLRHTHASLLVAAGTPIKVVSERLGHANPGFTMATYQHVMPGMGAEAADRFSQLLARHPVDVYRPDRPRTQRPQRSAEPAGRSTR